MARQTKREGKLEMPVWISEAEFADQIGYSIESLRKMRARGYVEQACKTKMPPYYKFGRGIRYKTSDIYNWMEQFRQAS